MYYIFFQTKLKRPYYFTHNRMMVAELSKNDNIPILVVGLEARPLKSIDVFDGFDIKK